MNEHAYGLTGTIPGDLKSAQPEAESTIGGLVDLSDQLSAAVSDVWDAWWCVKEGPRPAMPAVLTTPAPPLPSDRIKRLDISFHEHIRELRNLATEMRSRA